MASTYKFLPRRVVHQFHCTLLHNAAWDKAYNWLILSFDAASSSQIPISTADIILNLIIINAILHLTPKIQPFYGAWIYNLMTLVPNCSVPVLLMEPKNRDVGKIFSKLS